MRNFVLVLLAGTLSIAPQAQSPTTAGPAFGQSPLPTTSGIGFAGAPYSATETTIKETTTADGAANSITQVTFLRRDADGRTRQEHIQKSSPSAVEHRSIIITDPLSGVYLKWTEGDDIAVKTATIWPMDPKQQTTVMISDLLAMSTPPAGISPCGSGCTRENLGLQQINGVPALGVRTSRSVSDAADAKDQDFVNELWTSPELRIIVRHITDDPRAGKITTGKTTTDVTEIVRGDQDPGLFRIPDGYKVRDMRGATDGTAERRDSDAASEQ